MSVFVARQPIFDRKKKVYGYELLFRSGLENAYDSSDPDGSTLEVITNSLFVIGMDDLTGGKMGFINFTRKLLTDQVGSLLPKGAITVEILEDIEPDEEVLDALRKLKEAGHMLAMDDFVTQHIDSPMIELADIIKVDFMATAVEERKRIFESLADKNVKMLAEKIETTEDFDQALDCGYSYFQGYFFSKPIIRQGKQISGNKLTYLRLMNEVNKPGLSYEEIEALVRQDLSLTYKLLRFMNSAWFGFRAEISSIKHALVLLGPQEIKKWFALVALRHMASDKPDELGLRSMTRARACELLGPLVGMEKRAGDLFLMGMFSFIDALTDMPLADVLGQLPLKEDVKSALQGTPSRLRSVFDTIRTYEMGQWDEFAASAADLNLDEQLVPEVFDDALKWARQAFETISSTETAEMAEAK